MSQIGCAIVVAVALLVFIVIGIQQDSKLEDIEKRFVPHLDAFCTVAEQSSMESGNRDADRVLVLDIESHRIDRSVQNSLPEDWRPSLPEDVAFVVHLKSSKVLVGGYGGSGIGGGGKAFRIDRHMSIFRRDGREVATEVIQGSDPPSSEALGRDRSGRPPSVRKTKKAIVKALKVSMDSMRDRQLSQTATATGSSDGNMAIGFAILLLLMLYPFAAHALQRSAIRQGIDQAWRAWIPLTAVLLLLELKERKSKVEESDS